MMGPRVETAEQRSRLGHLLKVALQPSWPVDVHVFSVDAQADYHVVYGRLGLSMTEARELVAAAGLVSAGEDPLARVLLRSGWNLDPADPPAWWPADPASLDDQAARQVEPSGWLLGGYKNGFLYLLVSYVGTHL